MVTITPKVASRIKVVDGRDDTNVLVNIAESNYQAKFAKTSSNGVDIYHVRDRDCFSAEQHYLTNGKEIFVLVDSIESFVKQGIRPALDGCLQIDLGNLPSPRDMEEGQLSKLLLFKQFGHMSPSQIANKFTRFVEESAAAHKMYSGLENALARNMLVYLRLFSNRTCPFLVLIFLITEIGKNKDTPEAKQALKILLSLSLEKKQIKELGFAGERIFETAWTLEALIMPLRTIALETIRRGGPLQSDLAAISQMFASFKT